MGSIKEFQCTYENASGINGEITKDLGLTFPDAYLKAESIAVLAKAIKEYEGADFCELPFCHVLEAEAMGASINYGDEKSVPRRAEYLYKKAEQLKDLPEMDFTSGRMYETLKACRILKDRGERVVFEITGPFSMLNVMMDVAYMFKELRKHKEDMVSALKFIGTQIIRYVDELQKYGVDVIQYADAICSVSILGEETVAEMMEVFTFGLIREMRDHIQGDTMLLLCPKTTFALLGTEKAVLKDVPLSAPMRFGPACLEMLGKVRIGGQMCIKNIEYELKNGLFKEVVLQ